MMREIPFTGKRVLVMGLGLHGGGAGAVEFLTRCGARVTVTDLRARRELAPTLRGLKNLRGIRYVLGKHRMADFRSADLIVKNPGVRPDSPFLREARRAGVPITSDIGMFFRLCPASIIGITGTRGKSTTTYLIWKLLKTKFGSRVHYGGNIRKSVLTILPRIRKDDLAVLELSSFQLQDLTHEKISPHVAVFTNLLCDHLNRHRDMREYAAAKSVIFRFQKPGDRLFYNGGDPAVKRLAVRASRRVGTRAAPRVPAALQTIVDKNLGAHYRVSVALAVAVARHFDVSEVAIARTLRAFHGLPARQEEIAARGGVHFVNDTTATIPDAAVAAIRRFRALAGPRHRVILIAGGQDKELDFRGMAREIKKSVDALILLPGTATDVLMAMSLIRTNKGHSSDVTTIQDKALPVNPHTFPRGIEPRGKDFSNTRSSPRQSRGAFWEGMGMKRASSMQEAVRTAYKIARRGDYVVLSPGAASFGLFLNEFDRGDQFVDAVRKLER